MFTLARFDTYLARLIIVPLLSSLVIAAMLLLLDRMLRLFDFVMNEGGPVNVVWRMLGNLLPEYLSLGIPIGVMMGILMAFRRLALSSELDALRAVGISYNRLLRVPFLFALFFAVVNFFIVGWLQPVTRYAYENLRFELRSGALGASIKVGEFASPGQGHDAEGRGKREPGGQSVGPVRARRKRGWPERRGDGRHAAPSLPPTIPMSSCCACATARWCTRRSRGRCRACCRSNSMICR